MTQEATPNLLSRLSSALAGVVEKVSPSVVRVDDGSRLTATGIAWGGEGVIVTTSHGVERDEEIVVETGDGARHAATLVGRDPDTDLAVLRVAATTLPAVETAPADEVKVGHLALALGRPGNAGLQATIGIVSARLETQTGDIPEYILHTDAVLYPGFSGGPLVDTEGRMVGLVNRMFGRGTGVALGVPLVERVAQALLAHGRVPRGYLGVRTQLVELPAALRQTLGISEQRGLLVVAVESGSPAESGGVLLGDILLRLGEQSLQDVDALRGHLHAGKSASLQVVRGGTLQTLSVTPGAAE